MKEDFAAELRKVLQQSKKVTKSIPAKKLSKIDSCNKKKTFQKINTNSTFSPRCLDFFLNLDVFLCQVIIVIIVIIVR